MNIFFKYNLEAACRTLLTEKLNKYNLDCTVTGMGSATLNSPVPLEQYHALRNELSAYGIDIIDNRKAVLTQQVKQIIMTVITYDKAAPLVKISSYISEKLGENYRTVSQAFSEVCHMTIESFIIHYKIELAKQLLITENVSLTEISYRLNYSSVAHLSNQFKKITGFTPSAFQKLCMRRRKPAMTKAA